MSHRRSCLVLTWAAAGGPGGEGNRARQAQSLG